MKPKIPSAPAGSTKSGSCAVLFWSKKVRTTPWMMLIVVIFINIGMWFERFVIVITSLHRDFLPSSWGYFSPTIIDVLTYLGSFGLFFTMFLLFAKYLPVIALSEVKGVMPESSPHHGQHGKAEAHA